MMSARIRKNVSFSPRDDVVIPKSTDHIEIVKEELKCLWYSRDELTESCLEAKKTVKLIHSVNGNMDAIDHSKVCVVGLEKFHAKKEREKYKKLLIKSVLIRQEINRGLGIRHDAECLCEISQMISNSFKEFALWQATMHKFHAYNSTSTQQQQQQSLLPPPPPPPPTQPRQQLLQPLQQLEAEPAQDQQQQQSLHRPIQPSSGVRYSPVEENHPAKRRRLMTSTSSCSKEVLQTNVQIPTSSSMVAVPSVGDVGQQKQDEQKKLQKQDEQQRQQRLLQQYHQQEQQHNASQKTRNHHQRTGESVRNDIQKLLTGYCSL